MAFWYNRWTLSGRVVKDPGPPRYLPSGQPQLDFMIANSRPSAGKGTTQTEQVSFFEIVTRGRQADACAEHLRKGSPVFIEGEAMQMAYPASGNAPIRKRVVLRARMVWFLAPGINMTAAEDPSGVEVPE